MTAVDWQLIKENFMMVNTIKGQEKLVSLTREDWQKIRVFVDETIDMRQKIKEFLE